MAEGKEGGRALQAQHDTSSLLLPALCLPRANGAHWYRQCDIWANLSVMKARGGGARAGRAGNLHPRHLPLGSQPLRVA